MSQIHSTNVWTWSQTHCFVCQLGNVRHSCIPFSTFYSVLIFSVWVLCLHVCLWTISACLCHPCSDNMLIRLHSWDFSEVSWRYNLTANFRLFQFLFPLPKWSPSLRSRGCVVNVSVGARHPKLTGFLHFDFFFFFATVFICSKKLVLFLFFWHGIKPILTCGYKDKYLECS